MVTATGWEAGSVWSSLIGVADTTAVWLATAAGQPLLQRLDTAARVKVFTALAALGVLGFAMIFFAWVAARAVRRYVNQNEPAPPRPTINPDDWASKPLVPDPGSHDDSDSLP